MDALACAPACVELLIPVSDAWSKSGDGAGGVDVFRPYCPLGVRPASAFAKRHVGSGWAGGKTAWMLAGQGRCAPLAEMIAAYDFAMSERSAIDSSSVAGECRKAALPTRIMDVQPILEERHIASRVVNGYD